MPLFRCPAVPAAVSGLTLCLIGTLPATAEQPAHGTTVFPDDTLLTVTASRRPASVQDLPLSVVGIRASDIEQQAYQDTSDLLAFVPGLHLIDRGGRQDGTLIVRGVHVNPLSSDDDAHQGAHDRMEGPKVSRFLGDLPLPVDLRLDDLERVEVLLGPQGVLYGAGTLGGVIRYIPVPPTFDQGLLRLRSGLSKTAHSDDLSYDVGLTFNQAIGTHFALRGSIDLDQTRGFIDAPFLVKQPGISDPDPDFDDATDRGTHLAPRQDIDSEETWSGRIAARWVPTGWLDGTLTYYAQREDTGGRRFSSRRSGLPAGKYDSANRILEPNRLTSDLLGLEVVADLGVAELVSATAMSRVETKGRRDQTDALILLEFDYEEFPQFVAFAEDRERRERISQEVRLTSVQGGRLRWLAGLGFNRLEHTRYLTENLPGYADFLGFTGDTPLEYFTQSFTDWEESAVFAELGYDVTDRLRVTLGGRYFDYERETLRRVDFPLGDRDFLLPSLADIETNLRTDFAAGLALGEETGPDGTWKTGQSETGALIKFDLSYDITDEIMTYFAASQGYRTGDSSGLDPCPEWVSVFVSQGQCALRPGQRWGPRFDSFARRDETQYVGDHATSYELGLKSRLHGGDLTLNGAAYFIQWHDPQVYTVTLNRNVAIAANTREAETAGVDIWTDWQASGRLRIQGRYSHTQTRLASSVSRLVETLWPGSFDARYIKGERGDRLPGSPENKVSILASYDVGQLYGRDVSLNLGYSWHDDILTRVGGKGDSLTLDASGQARAAISLKDAGWTATLFIDNLFDEYIETDVRKTPLFNQSRNGATVRSHGAHVAPPRTIGVRLNWDIWSG